MAVATCAGSRALQSRPSPSGKKADRENRGPPPLEHRAFVRPRARRAETLRYAAPPPPIAFRSVRAAPANDASGNSLSIQGQQAQPPSIGQSFAAEFRANLCHRFCRRETTRADIIEPSINGSQLRGGRLINARALSLNASGCFKQSFLVVGGPLIDAPKHVFQSAVHARMILQRMHRAPDTALLSIRLELRPNWPSAPPREAVAYRCRAAD
jgi:hypothetical protein